MPHPGRRVPLRSPRTPLCGRHKSTGSGPSGEGRQGGVVEGGGALRATGAQVARQRRCCVTAPSAARRGRQLVAGRWPPPGERPHAGVEFSPRSGGAADVGRGCQPRWRPRPPQATPRPGSQLPVRDRPANALELLAAAGYRGNEQSKQNVHVGLPVKRLTLEIFSIFRVHVRTVPVFRVSPRPDLYRAVVEA